jgi:hypothetical protein
MQQEDIRQGGTVGGTKYCEEEASPKLTFAYEHQYSSASSPEA